MLSKLIKHEFRALSRFLLPIHILLLVACLIGRFMFQAMAMMDLRIVKTYNIKETAPHLSGLR